MQHRSEGDRSPANHNHPGIDWSRAPEFGRRQTLLKALQRLYMLHPGPVCIVETGTLRDDQSRGRDGDGWSTLAWGWYAAQTGGAAHTVDISPEAIAVCRRHTRAYASHLCYICSDSIAFLRRWGQEQRGEIHLLYLDSLDYVDHDRSEQHHLEEARAALPLLAPCCLVLLDDTTSAGGTDTAAFIGKGARAIPFLLQQGFCLEWCENGQALLARGTLQAHPRPRSAPLWQPALDPTPLNQVPGRFTVHTQSSCLAPYLAAILKLCPPDGKTCEVGVTTGYAPIWLSLYGREALGITAGAQGVERARQVNNILQGRARFRRGDLLDLSEDDVRYDVIHHQGVIHRFTVPVIHAILAHQVAAAERVVFSVPSVYHAPGADEDEERLLPIEEWRRILAPFDVVDLRYYGDGVSAGREHLLCVLAGQPIDALLRARMHVPAEPYPQGISAIVHTRNEAHQLADCLETLTGWTDEIIVCDMESDDGTVNVARRTTANVLSHPRIGNIDQARNVSALRARYRWVLYLDADERIPRPLGNRLRELCLSQGEEFEALSLPFLHGFAGRWMQSLYPGYKAPSLFKNGRFYYHTRLHAGARVKGHIALFSTENQDLAPRHYSYSSLAHYLDKLNRYTDTEADNLRQDGERFHWTQAIDAFVRDFQGYYGAGHGAQDGVHGFLWAFLSGFYRFMQHAKLFEQRFRDHQLAPAENEVPTSLEQMLEYALAATRRQSQPPATPLCVDGGAGAAEVAWCGPLLDPSGYGEECRNLLLALADADVAAAGQAIRWSDREAAMDGRERRRLQERLETPVAPGFIQIVQAFAPHFQRHPQAGIAIGRTMFETDRLPTDWVGACNRMDAIWVPSEFNRRTFRDAGVQAEKLAVIPGCLNPALYTPLPRGPHAGLGASGGSNRTRTQAIAEMEAHRAANRFLFVSLFDWTRHKGWDILLRGFLEAFEGRDDVSLVLKVWSTLDYTDAQIRQQAADFARQELGHDLPGDPRIRFVQEYLTPDELILLYRASDAFVLPSRGEGWGRPYMEAMACGLPTIGTDWSGNTAFMTADNSYLLNYELKPVPEAGWRELPAYRGHRWAEPDVRHLKEQLRRVVEERAEALARGRLAREDVTERFSRAAVGKLMAAELTRLQEYRRPHPVPVAPAGVEQSETEQSQSEQSQSEQGALTVRWEGAQLCWHSLAHVNREFCLALMASGSIELAVIPTEAEEFSPQDDSRLRPLSERAFQPLSGPAVVHIRHQFPPRLDPPEEGHFVLIQPWEFGALPQEWVEPIRKQVAEVWCYSRYVKEVYLASGIPADRLHIVPLGVDTDIYRPTAPPYCFTTEPGATRRSHGSSDPFVFLYVGGTIHRKGFDILLEAYLRAFGAYDDICLVIKDTGTNSVYRGQNAKEEILRLLADPHRPRILYVEENLTAHQMAGIYTAADCLVAPYRGEGFCLPALEAMACGLPVIVPEGGPTDDFVDDSVGWRLAAERRPVPGGRVGSWECVEEPWILEVDIDALARQMRLVMQDRAEAARRGQNGASRVQRGWTWDHAAAAALQRMKALREIPPPLRPVRKAASTPPSPASASLHALALQADISLCMIVKNEERVLPDCLHSARPFFREMIVVDTGSTDRTREIIVECGAQLYESPWKESFAEARNQSLSHAKGRWIAWLDADDTLPFASGEAILQAALNAPPDIVGFVVPVQFVDDGTQAGGTRVDHVKLFRNVPGVAFEGRIHEQILPSLKAHGTIARCNALVLHSGYDTSPEGQARKRARDARLLELELAERPDHPFVLFCLGMTDHYGGEQEGAVRWLRRCIAVSGSNESHVRKAYALLAVALRELGRSEESLQTVREGLGHFPEDPELHFHAAFLLTAQGKYAEAKGHYLQTLAHSDISDHYSSVDMGILGYKTYHNLGMLCRLLEDYPEARTWWLKAVEAAPTFLPSAFDLFDSAVKEQDFSTARQMLERVRATEGSSENWARMSVRYAEAVGGADNAEAWLRQALATEPHSLGIRLVLARRLLQTGREREAQEYLLTLSQAGNAEATYFLGVMAIRANDLRQALNWMERALALNPTHTETSEQIQNLRQALGLNTPSGISISLDEALEQVAHDLNLDAATLQAYAAEDQIGGYTVTASPLLPGSPNHFVAHHLPLPTPWPGGSVWEGEGKLLYALVRALKPQVLVEVGSLVGCSTSHLALACCRNGEGKVYAVDPAADFSRIDPSLLPYIEPIKADVFTWMPPEGIDFVFEDGAHTPGFTRETLRKLLPWLKPGAAVLCHDVCQAELGGHITAEFAEMMEASAKSLLISPSDCGLGYAVYEGY